MSEGPERKHTISIKIGADTWDDALATLNNIQYLLHKDGPGRCCVSGGVSSNYIVVDSELPGMTNEKYFAELDEWLGRERKKDNGTLENDGSPDDLD